MEKTTTEETLISNLNLGHKRYVTIADYVIVIIYWPQYVLGDFSMVTFSLCIFSDTSIEVSTDHVYLRLCGEVL